MQLVTLPALRHRALETLSHTAASAAHLLAHRTQVAFVFNAANAPLLPILRAARVPVATHVDGLEWQRGKWGPAGRRYYRAAEREAVRWSDALIADAAGIADYYTREFAVPTTLLAYGAPTVDGDVARLADLGLAPGGYHLAVARFEVENHVEVIVDGYVSSRAHLPLVVVGSAPYADAYTARVHAAARGDARVRFAGAVWDQDLLDALYAHACTYLHGHSVGGTNPSLLRALGAGTATIAYRVGFNQEVLRDAGRYFADAADLAVAVEDAEADPQGTACRAQAARARATDYDWDDVAAGYQRLAWDLAQRRTPGPHGTARRRPAGADVDGGRRPDGAGRVPHDADRSAR
jgi:glycosyltransferase involved in cell wall biosynthesis